MSAQAAALRYPVCEHCGEAIARRPDERLHVWIRRRFCSVEHFQADEAEGHATPGRAGWPRPLDRGRETELYGDLRYEDVISIVPPRPPVPAPPLMR